MLRRIQLKISRTQWNNIWFTSDWHLAHDRPFIWEKRGFKNIAEHDEFLMDTYNTLVQTGDLVFNMGDFTFKNSKYINNVLENRLVPSVRYFVKGDHDKYTNKHTISESLEEITIDDQPITLSHFAMLSWNKSHYGAWNICGHTHGSLPESLPEHVVGKRLDVGVDVGLEYNDKFMFTFEDVQRIMSNKIKTEHH